MARNKKPIDPDAPVKARKAPFRPSAMQKTILVNALKAYRKSIEEAPEHPLVDKDAVLAATDQLVSNYS